MIPEKNHITESEAGGHAVVLADYETNKAYRLNYIEFHNSWGDEFGIQGSFKI